MLRYRLECLMKKAMTHQLVFDKGYAIESGKTVGWFSSQVVPLPKSERMVVSWNCRAENGTSVEIKVRIKASEGWTPWMSYGIWGNGKTKGSISNQVYGSVGLEVDEIIATKGMSSCQVGFNLVRESDTQESPILTGLFVAVKDSVVHTPLEIVNIDLEVPQISQMMLHNIGTIACSPTALTMVLKYYGFEKGALEVADNCYDAGSSSYGNWSYNVAYAGSQNFEAYVDYCSSVESLMKMVQCGIPIVVSVQTDDVIAGAPQAYPEGHLLVVRGFWQEEETYVIVNDPASKSEGAVRRLYKLSDFLKIWRRVIYVVKPRSCISICN